MNNVYTFRTETPNDYREVENLTREAFWNVYQPGCDEHYIVHIMRGQPEVVTELNDVCLLGGRIVGHIFYTRTKVAAQDGRVFPVLSFGPVSVHPDVQHTGIGSRLITSTMQRAAQMGFSGIVITGNPKYYHRFGFFPASDFGIVSDDGSSFPELMAAPLAPGSLSGVSGRMYFAPGFSQPNPDDVARFDAHFPPKQRQRLPGQLW